MNLIRLNLKKFSLRHTIIKLQKIENKEKILKAEKENNALPTEEHQFESQWISHLIPQRPKEVTHFSSAKRKNGAKSYIQQNYLLRIKKK